MRTSRARWALLAGTAVSCLLAVAAQAQTGAVRGKVVDQEGKPIEGVEVCLEYLDGVSRQFTISSNAKGDFAQVGLRSGNYRVTLRKPRHEPVVREIRVQTGEPFNFGDVILMRLPEGVLSSEELGKLSAEVQGYFEKGAAAVEGENYAAALASFQKVIELAPTSAEAYFNMGFVHTKMKEPEKALPLYQKAVELRPDYYEAYVELGNICNDRRQYAEAMGAFQKATELKPGEVAPLYNYGVVAMNAGEMTKAQEAFEKLIAADPNHADANYQLGMVCVNLTKNDQAIRHLERYLELAPDGPRAATARSVLDYLKKS